MNLSATTTLILSILLVTALSASSQLDTITNSFEQYYKNNNLKLQYKYDRKQQIHDYSNNWDFDGDGKSDSLYFVGTGGAHLYYFLRVILSSDGVTRNFSFLESDFPVLATYDEIAKIASTLNSGFPKFAVFDYGNNNSTDIFISLDDQSLSTNQVLKKKGVKSKRVIISFENGKAIFKDLVHKN